MTNLYLYSIQNLLAHADYVLYNARKCERFVEANIYIKH